MTFFHETAAADKTQYSEFKQFWSALAEIVNRSIQNPRKKGDAPQRSALPKSGMPISNDVVTKLSIRAGHTAGPW